MDPRVSLKDILMRQECSEDRQRMTDIQYINKHFTLPGYRTYRPAWKMIAWHAKMSSETDYIGQKAVLDALTDAQKNANTTRYVHFRLFYSYLILDHKKLSGKKAPFYS